MIRKFLTETLLKSKKKKKVFSKQVLGWIKISFKLIFNEDFFVISTTRSLISLHKIPEFPKFAFTA